MGSLPFRSSRMLRRIGTPDGRPSGSSRIASFGGAVHVMGRCAAAMEEQHERDSGI